MEIDFDKLLSDSLERIEKNNPNHDNDSALRMNKHFAKTAAIICVSIIKDYEKMKSSQDV